MISATCPTCRHYMSSCVCPDVILCGPQNTCSKCGGTCGPNTCMYESMREMLKKPTMKEAVNNPTHYGGKDNPYEAIKVIEAWELGFNLGNTTKYISRAGKKNPDKKLEDLQKALWYLQREIDNEIQNRG